MPAEAEIILFGIQAALRINEQFRHAFADSTRSRAITLPLPDFPARADRSTWENFYRGGDGKEFFVTNLRVRYLLNKLSDTGTLLGEENAELGDLYQEHLALLEAGRGGRAAPQGNLAGLTNEDVVHLITIRQWQVGKDPNPTLLRRMAGTLINIAVDYATEMPGVLSANTKGGRALQSLLEAFQGIDFATDGRSRVLEGMFVATLETVRDHPEIVSQEGRARVLLHGIAAGLYEDTRKFLSAPGASQSDRDRAVSWSHMVFHSVLESTSTTIFAQPEKFLGLKGGEADLVTNVGRAVLGSILTPAGVDLGGLVNQQSLDQITKAALLAVGQHPELLGVKGSFLQQLITTTATELSQSAGPLAKDFLPAALRLVLENTAENFELLLPSGPDHPEKHLLVVAAREALLQLASPQAANASWTPRLGSAEVLRVLETVADEVVQNPGWLAVEAGAVNSLLGQVTCDLLTTLREKAPPRLRKQTGLALLEAALRAAGRRLEFTVPGPQNRCLVARAVEAVLATVFQPGAEKAAWILARDTSLERLTGLVLEKLEKFGVSEDKLTEAISVLVATRQQLVQGGGWSWEGLSEQLDQALV